MTNLSEKLWKRTCFFNILKKTIVFFHGHFCSFTGIASCFFHVHEFEFHGQNLMKNFTGTFLFSRALFNVFSGFFTGTVFFFTGKKKHCIYIYTWIYTKKLSPTFLWVSKFHVKLGVVVKNLKITAGRWFFFFWV